MSQARLLSRMFEMNYEALFRNLEGITHEDSLVQPRPGGNSINWILGHILGSRNRVHSLFAVAEAWSPELAHRYSGLEDADWSPESAVDLRAIESDLARSQQALMGALDNAPPAMLSRQTNDRRTLAELVGFLQFHEAYHIGQVAIVRRIVGRPGVIRPPARRKSLPSDTG